jgi:hypothetical protein
MSWKTFAFWLENAELSDERRNEVKPSMVRTALRGSGGLDGVSWMAIGLEPADGGVVELGSDAYFVKSERKSSWLRED